MLSFEKTSINGFNGSLNLKVQEITLTLNENYILLLSKLVDENYEDVLHIIPKLKKESSEKIEAQSIEAPASYSSLFEKSEIKQLLELSDPQPIFFVQVASFKTEWIFGQTFDEHQDKFVTLNNRNFTKMILEKFDNQAKFEQKMSDEDSGERDDIVDEQI